MLSSNNNTYTIIPACQVVKGELITGCVVTRMAPSGKVLGNYFTTKTKASILEDIKSQNGIISKSQALVDKILRGEDI